MKDKAGLELDVDVAGREVELLESPTRKSTTVGSSTRPSPTVATVDQFPAQTVDTEETETVPAPTVDTEERVPTPLCGSKKNEMLSQVVPVEHVGMDLLDTTGTSLEISRPAPTVDLEDQCRFQTVATEDTSCPVPTVVSEEGAPSPQSTTE